MLSITGVTVEYPSKTVLERVSLGINEGDRTGIVGRNGYGKSTLLRVLAGTRQPDAGTVIPNGAPTVGLLGQTDALDSSKSIREQIGHDDPITWEADRSSREIVESLLAGIDLDEHPDSLSGGQRRRVDLARLLVGKWDILLLDEPTNHLDIAAINWLADHLKRRWPKGGGALLVVTHDRWFLDEVCTGMWEVHAGSVVPFEGGYSSYILQRVERQRLEALAKQKRANQLRKELAWLSRGAQARRSKPKFHLEKAAELIANEPPVRNPIELKNAAMARLGKQVIDLEDVAVSLDGRVILKNLTWSIGPGERIGILGENGAGKTTLLRLLEGIVQPSSGRMKTGKTVRLSSVTQGLEELAEFDDDVVRAACGRLKTFYEIDGKYYSPTALLERLGFSRDELNARCKDLSGGQRRRLRILFALLEEPNVLLLDEPGNDLDTDMMAAMEDLLDSWAGTLVVVSHDRYLLERVTDDLYAIVDGALRHMPGGVDEYLRHLNKANSMESDQGQAERKRETGASSQAYALRKKAASLERKIETQQGRVKEAQDRLDRCDPYDYEALVAAQENLDDQVGRLAQLEDEWLEVSEELQ